MPIQQQLAGRDHDLGGGFVVRRLLPDARQRSVGPFIFFDHFGPAEELPGVNHDVRPHPHIGLATVTYLFDGAMMHRDSLGTEQLIEPGAINWMTAGRGIVHSERRPEHLRNERYVNHGLQLWTALPLAQEEVAPSFSHTPADAIPECSVGDARVRVLVGEAFGARGKGRVLFRQPGSKGEVRVGEPHLGLVAKPAEHRLLVGARRRIGFQLQCLEHGAVRESPAGADVADQ